MASYTGVRRSSSSRRTRRRSGYTNVERLAYQMGQINKGLKNPDSKVHDAYCRGQQAQVRKKKPLF